MLGSCAFFSKTWIEVSGSSAKDVSVIVQLYTVLPLTKLLTHINLCVSGGKAAEGAADGNEGAQRNVYGARAQQVQRPPHCLFATHNI